MRIKVTKAPMTARVANVTGKHQYWITPSGTISRPTGLASSIADDPAKRTEATNRKIPTERFRSVISSWIVLDECKNRTSGASGVCRAGRNPAATSSPAISSAASVLSTSSSPDTSIENPSRCSRVARSTIDSGVSMPSFGGVASKGVHSAGDRQASG